MSKEQSTLPVVATPVGSLVQMDWTPDQVKLIKDTVCAGASDDEFKLFLYTARRTGLDPLVRQIHAVKRYNTILKRDAMTIQTGIDGYRVIAERSGTYAGQDAPVYTMDDKGNIESATITVYRIICGHRVSFSASAYFHEYAQTYRDRQTGDTKLNPMWEKMPRVMLAKCAEALAMRKAFPNDLSGVYTNEEMQQADDTPTVASEKQLDLIRRLKQKRTLPIALLDDADQFLVREIPMASDASELIERLLHPDGEPKMKVGDERNGDPVDYGHQPISGTVGKIINHAEKAEQDANAFRLQKAITTCEKIETALITQGVTDTIDIKKMRMLFLHTVDLHTASIDDMRAYYNNLKTTLQGATS